MRAYGPGKGCRRLSLVLLLFLAGCGGGGGGGGGSLPALVYSGSTSQATVTALNASRLSANIFGSNDTAGIISGTSMEGGAPASSATGMEGVTRTLNRATRRALAPLKPTRSAQGPTSGVAQPVNFTDPCTGGGSANTTGTLDNVTFTGAVTVTFNNCVEDGLTLNGAVNIQILAFSFFCPQGIPTDFIASIPRVTIRGSGVNVDGGGSLRVQTNVGLGTETITNDVISLNNQTGVMTMGQNLVSVGTPNFICGPTSISNLTFNGRIFDNVHGYTDVSTINALQINLPQPFPTTGEIRLAGIGNPLHVTALSSTRVQLQFDTDASGMGDGFAALMNWTDLTGPIGVDIADTDGDGMHNSWETFYGLNPGNPADAAISSDGGDGTTNLQEYQAGTNPIVP